MTWHPPGHRLDTQSALGPPARGAVCTEPRRLRPCAARCSRSRAGMPKEMSDTGIYIRLLPGVKVWFSLSVSACSTRPEHLARCGACRETRCLPGG